VYVYMSLCLSLFVVCLSHSFTSPLSFHLSLSFCLCLSVCLSFSMPFSLLLHCPNYLLLSELFVLYPSRLQASRSKRFPSSPRPYYIPSFISSLFIYSASFRAHLIRQKTLHHLLLAANSILRSRLPFFTFSFRFPNLVP